MNQQAQYEPSDPARGAVGGGSSTGAPGLPTGLRDQRSQYDASKGVNPSTGASYSKSSAGGPTQTRQQPLSPSPAHSDDRIVADEPLPHTASTAQRAEIQDHSRGSRAGDGIGKGIKGAAASVHGAGESLRGALNTAVDRAFGSNEGAERNQQIADKGAEEIRSGRFSHSK
ncbi:unnamed protein product [Penicillium bialowiezense]